MNNKKETSPWMILLTVMVGTLLIGLDRTVVSLGLPKIISEFGITVADAGWIATGYIISNAVFVPIFGKLGDMLGNRLLYFWSFVGFIIVSLFAGFAWDLSSLVFFRVLQGLVGAAVYPTALSLIAKTFHDKKARAQAMGIWSASFAASSVFGPLIGGPLIDNFSWRMLFYINVPIGLIGILMVMMYLPKDAPEEVGKFDYKGAVILAIVLSVLVFVLEKGQGWGWTSSNSLVSFLTIIISSIWFYYTEKNSTNPLIDLKFFKNPVFVSALAISFISFGGMMGAMFLLPVFAQTFLGFNATETGYLFLPMALTMFIAAPLGAMLSARMEPRYTVAGGMAIAAIGVFLFSGLDAKTTANDLTFPLILLAAGLGIGMAPLTSAATNSVPHHEVGIASGILNLTRNIAGAIGIALFGTILTNSIESKIFEISSSTTINTTSAQIQQIIPPLIILKAQIASYGHVFYIASIVMFIGAFVALFLKESSMDFSGTDKTSESSETAPVEF